LGDHYAQDLHDSLQIGLVSHELIFRKSRPMRVLQRDLEVEHGISIDMLACLELSVGVPVLFEAFVRLPPSFFMLINDCIILDSTKTRECKEAVHLIEQLVVAAVGRKRSKAEGDELHVLAGCWVK